MSRWVRMGWAGRGGRPDRGPEAGRAFRRWCLGRRGCATTNVENERQIILNITGKGPPPDWAFQQSLIRRESSVADWRRTGGPPATLHEPKACAVNDHFLQAFQKPIGFGQRQPQIRDIPNVAEM